MYPVIFTLGSLGVSTFLIFLLLAFFLSGFVIWRICTIYDTHKEEVFDIFFRTILVGFLGARIYTYLSDPTVFNSVEKFFFINRFPGLSFWGGVTAGIFGLWIFTKKTKLNFWQVADFAAVGVALGLVIGDLGCFLSGCAFGRPSNLFFALPVFGLVGKRIPISLLESVLFIFVFLSLWKQVIKFHFAGKISAYFLIILGVVKFMTEYYRGDRRFIGYMGVSSGQLFALSLILLGVGVFYIKSKRSVLEDVKSFFEIFYKGKKRKVVLLKMEKGWYNRKVDLKIKASKLKQFIKSLPEVYNFLKRGTYLKTLKKKLNVKSTPTNF